MRWPLAIVCTAGLVLGLALSASGAAPELRPRALALIAGGDVGANGDVFADGTSEDHLAGKGAVSVPGLTIDNGDAVARTDKAAGTARASAVARTVSLLGGRVTAYGIRRVAEAAAGGTAYSGRIEGLVVDGRQVGEVTDARTYVLSDGAGQVIINKRSIGLRLLLTAPVEGLPAGTDIRVAVADAEVRTVRPQATATPTPTPTPTPTATSTPPQAQREKTAKPRTRNLDRKPAPKIPKRLTRGGFAFPVYGGATFSDDYGGARAAPILSHQGNDVFAQFGAPVVAVTDGVVSKVGTLDISGNRLWLTSGSGDAFFYAHLSAFSPAAVNGSHVKAGTVLGFVGNTGDAEPTPPHVHFEVHPGGLEQPSVDPYRILRAWQGRGDIPASAWLQEYGPDTTQRPGALVTVRDFIAE